MPNSAKTTRKPGRPATSRYPLATPLAAVTGGELQVGPVLAIPALLTSLGVAPRRAFARAGVRLGLVADPKSRISFDDLGRLVAVCASLTGREHFGLLVAERFELTDIGAVGYLMQNSATVGDAVRALHRHLHLWDRGAAPVLLSPDPSRMLVGYSLFRSANPGAAQIYDGAIGITHRMLAALCGPTWKPLRVQLSRRRPSDVQPYRQFFGTDVRFDAEVSGIVIASSWLDRPIAGADPALRKLVDLAIRKVESNQPIGFAAEVRGMLHQMVLAGTSSATDVARLFGIKERALRARLGAEGTSFQQLVAEARFELAQRLLHTTRLPVSEIAATLHYADPNVFSRAFRNWANASPTQWRARQ